MSSSGTSGDACHVGSISSITILTLDWFDNRIIKVNDKIVINCILIR